MGHMVALGIIFTSVLCFANAYDPAECDISETYYTIFKIGKHNCDCQSSRAGQLKFDNGKVFVCTGSEWKAMQYEVSYGGKSNPGSSCEDINNAGRNANGIYWIKRNVPDPVAFYPLNSAYGTKEINNRVAQGVSSGVTLAPGHDGAADGSYEFSGTSNSYIEFPNNKGGPLDVRYSMTMLCWVYHNGQDGPLFNYKTSGSWGVHLWVVSGKLFVRFTRRDYSFTTHLSHTSLTGGWKFVGASYDRGSGEAKLWVDGAVVQTLNIGASLELATQDPIRMGVKIGDRRYFKGRIAQMQVYNEALGQEQIRALKQRTSVPDKRNAFPVYCDMAAGGWTMVFKAVSGVEKSAYDTFNNGQTSSEEVMAALDTTNHHMDHYKNRIVLNWKDFDASEARVVLYKGGKRMMELKFNAHGSDKFNWFSFSRLTQSPWSDIKTQARNYFSIRGEPAHKRYFFINRNYGGCPSDAGWMMVAGPICSWEKHYLPRKNVILYSKLPGYTNWNHYQNVGVADVLVVYVR